MNTPGFFRLLLTLALLLTSSGAAGVATPRRANAQGGYYVATDGDDDTGDGSISNPWATITHALDNVPDGSTILVRPGDYTGRVRVRWSSTLTATGTAASAISLYATTCCTTVTTTTSSRSTMPPITSL